VSYEFTTLAEDTFHRPDENPLSDGGNWNQINGDDAAQVVSDVCEPTVTATNPCGAVYTGIVWPTNPWASLTISFNAADNPLFELYQRLTNDGNFATGYTLQISPTTGAITLSANATDDVLYSDTLTFSNGDVILLGFFGTTWLVYRNGVQLSTGSDASTPSGGTAGFDLGANNAITSAQALNFSGGEVTQSSGGGSGKGEAAGYGTDISATSEITTNPAGETNSTQTSIFGTNRGTRFIG
jgi:hypothetical protein